MSGDLKARLVSLCNQLIKLFLCEVDILAVASAVDEDLHPSDPQPGTVLLPWQVALVPVSKPVVLPVEREVGVDT